jgi:hypothetical protein
MPARSRHHQFSGTSALPRTRRAPITASPATDRRSRPGIWTTRRRGRNSRVRRRRRPGRG